VVYLRKLINPGDAQAISYSHIRPDQRDSAAWNTSTLIANFDCDVLLSFHYNDLNWWKYPFAIDAIVPKSLHHSSQRVLEVNDE
jgi:hypothetical protein